TTTRRTLSPSWLAIEVPEPSAVERISRALAARAGASSGSVSAATALFTARTIGVERDGGFAGASGSGGPSSVASSALASVARAPHAPSSPSRAPRGGLPTRALPLRPARDSPHRPCETPPRPHAHRCGIETLPTDRRERAPPPVRPRSPARRAARPLRPHRASA